MGRYAYRPRIWSLERVVAELQALHASGELGSSHALGEAGNRELVSAAQRYAGSWERAMKLAGLAYEPRRRWTKDLVVREIRRLHRSGKSTAQTQVENALATAATRQFGSWKKARAAAVPSLVAPYEDWTKQRLLDAIADRYKRGIPLSASGLRKTGDGRLINASVRLFGSWSQACRRAVRGYKPLQQSWTRAGLLRAIRTRSRAGLSMSATAVYRGDCKLLAAATRFFDSWPAARAAAGVAYRDPRNTWPKERVIAELRRRSTDGTRPRLAVVGQALYKVAVARFGSYTKACRAAKLVSHRKPRS